jgi:hypothetical protein
MLEREKKKKNTGSNTACWVIPVGPSLFNYKNKKIKKFGRPSNTAM